MDGWNTFLFPLGFGLFSEALAVSFREGKSITGEFCSKVWEICQMTLFLLPKKYSSN